MSDVAGTPLPTTGSTTQTSTTSAGHSPTFTGATNGFQVTEEVDINLATTATGPFCTKVTQPGAIEYYQGGTWWSHVFDYNAQTSSGNTHLAVTSYQILEILSINYIVAGITQPNPFGANSPFLGQPYYRVMVECVVGGYQPNYNTGDVVTFMSTNYWNPGYLATAFRLIGPANSSCVKYTDTPISSNQTVEMPVAQSVSVALPTTGSNTQTANGTGGGIGFIDGGGGDGWNGCPGGTSGSSDDSNWNPQQTVTHSSTFTGTSGVIPTQISGYPLPSSGSSSQSTCPNDGWLSFIDGGGGEGWMDCNGDGQDDGGGGGGGGGGGNDSHWNPKAPNVHAATYTERVAGPNGGFIVSPTNGCKQLSSGTFSIWQLRDGIFVGGAIPDIYEIISIVYNGTTGAQNPFSLCPTYDRWIVNYRKSAGGSVRTTGFRHGASSGCPTITWEIIPGDPNAACTIPYP